MRTKVIASLIVALAPAAPALAQDNSAKQTERRTEYSPPSYQQRLARESDAGFARALALLREDPERNFLTDVCWSKALILSPCAGDIRLYDWGPKGYGLVEPVLFTNRSGATISGHVWSTLAGPALRPGIVITNGSVQATEEMYWWAAQTLAKAGYVVLTSDPQNQGMSDTFGEGADLLEGTLSQLSGNTFTDGTEDALDFFLSTPRVLYCARPSRSGTSHCAKQRRRVRAGRNAAHNPFWQRVDPTRIGIAGHSYGAQGVSFIGQKDRRVDAIVAWDNLCAPSDCIAPNAPPPAPRVPALGISQDFLTGPIPNPLPDGPASKDLSAAGIDNGQLAIRGGTHFEYAYLPTEVFPATLRGIQLSAWYTQAWFDKYVKGDATADRRLLTTRWRNDSGDRRIDPAGGGNVWSFQHKSRIDIRRGATRVTCEDLRAGCAGLGAADGGPGEYSFLGIVRRSDRPDPAARGKARLTAKTSPRRDRRPPYRFTTSGRLVLPTGLDRRAACRGTIRVTFAVRGRKRTVRARVGRNCRYRVAVRVRSRGRVRVMARFGGSSLLLPASARAQRVSTGR